MGYLPLLDVERRRGSGLTGVQAVQIHLSTDGGLTFPTLVASPAPADSEYAWTIPLQLTNEACIRVTANDAAGNPALDASDATFTITTATDIADLPPVTRTWLDSPVPNPFNPTAHIRYSLLKTARVRLAIYDARGRLIRKLVDAVQTDRVGTRPCGTAATMPDNRVPPASTSSACKHRP